MIYINNKEFTEVPSYCGGCPLWDGYWDGSSEAEMKELFPDYKPVIGFCKYKGEMRTAYRKPLRKCVKLFELVLERPEGERVRIVTPWGYV